METEEIDLCLSREHLCEIWNRFAAPISYHVDQHTKCAFGELYIYV